MAQRSAGLMLFRRNRLELEVLLVHPGGPYWINKDEGAWSIPKGQFEDGEHSLAAAKREFHEETGMLPKGPFIHLGRFVQPSGKVIYAWAVEGDFDPRGLKCNRFSIEWPPHSGRAQDFPEVDRAEWFKVGQISSKITTGQLPILQELLYRRRAVQNGLDRAPKNTIPAKTPGKNLAQSRVLP